MEMTLIESMKMEMGDGPGETTQLANLVCTERHIRYVKTQLKLMEAAQKDLVHRNLSLYMEHGLVNVTINKANLNTLEANL